MGQREKPLIVDLNTPFVQPKRSWRLGLIVFTGVGVGVLCGFYLAQFRFLTSPTTPIAKTSPQINQRAVAALGHLEPAGEITRLSAPNSLEGTRIEEVRVEAGDKVAAGQVVATLTTRKSRAAALLKAQTQVQIAQAQLARVEAGAKTSDINAQSAAIERLQAEVVNAQTEYERNRDLFEQGAISASARDSKQLMLNTLKAQLKQAQANLQSVAEVRPEDVQVSRTQVENAIATVKAAEVDLELTHIRSPIAGQVLKVHARSGEIVGPNGIAEIAKTDTMYAVAEVYETDIQKIYIGQKAIVTSPAIAGELEGTVAKVGLQVEQQNTFKSDPLAKTDNRVIEVKVALNSEANRRVVGLTHLQVQVIFQK